MENNLRKDLAILLFIVLVLSLFVLDFDQTSPTGAVTALPEFNPILEEYEVNAGDSLIIPLSVNFATKLTTNSDFAVFNENKLILKPIKKDIGFNTVVVLAKSELGVDILPLKILVTPNNAKQQLSTKQTTSLNLLNPSSKPQVGGLWNVFFKTKGEGTLIIESVGETYFDEDIILNRISCSNKHFEPVRVVNNKFLIKYFSCDKTSVISNRVLTKGEHYLEITFKDEMLLAQNNATTAPWFTNAPNNISCTQELECYYDFDANDVQGDNTSLVYTEDSDMIIINETTGVFNFTPTNSQVRNYTGSDVIVFIVTDQWGNVDTEVIELFILNANDAPQVISTDPASSSASVLENTSAFIFNVTVQDIDFNTPYNENLTIAWYFDSILNKTTYENVLETSTHSWNFSTGFCENSTYNLTVNVSDVGGLSNIFTWDITITNVNRNPVFNSTINNKTWYQDQNLTNNFTLEGKFYDLDSIDCGENLTYSSNGESNIAIAINQTTGNVSFYPDQYFYGNETVTFIATDDASGTNSSNEVTLEVLNIPDVPWYNSVSNQTLYANAPFYLELTATDHDNDDLTFAVNDTSLFTLTKTGLQTAEINFTPLDADVGIKYYFFNLTDNYPTAGNPWMNHTDNMSLTFNITSNTIPTINEIADRIIAGAYEVRINLTGGDPDLDDMTFHSNSSFFTITYDNRTDSHITYTPLPVHAGTHVIEFWTRDEHGALSLPTNSTWNITEVNAAPDLTEITDFVITVDRYFEYNVTATDLEDDTLTFYTNSTLFNITSFNEGSAHKGLINFTPNSSDIGNHSFLVNVTDGTSWDSTTFGMEIIPNSPPIFEGNYSNLSIKEGHVFTLQMNASDINLDEIKFYSNDYIFPEGYVNIDLTGFLNDTFSPVSIQNFSVRLSEYVNGVATGIFTDGNFSINVLPANNPPTIVNSTPNATNVSLSENATIRFEINATDLENDILTYNWTLETLIFNYSVNDTENGTYIVNATKIICATESYCDFTPDFLMSGMKNLTILVTDNKSEPVSNKWNLNISNVNRPPVLLNNFSTITGWYVGTTHNWVTLSNYLHDYDIDENVTYTFQGDSDLSIIVNETTYFAKVITPPVPGTNTLTVNITDPYNETLQSNSFSISWQEIPGQTNTDPTPEPEIKYRTRTVKEREDPISVDIIVPDPIEAGLDETLIVPLGIRNTNDLFLNDISLTVNNIPGLQLTLQNSFFDSLAPGEERNATLIIKTSFEEQDYQINLVGTGTDPVFNDTAIIYLSTITPFEEDVEEINIRIAYAKDLLNSNPECFDLKENLQNIVGMVKQSQMSDAADELENVISACNYLTAPKKEIVEEIPDKSLSAEIPFNILLIGIAVLVIAVILGLFLLKTAGKKK